MKKDFRPIKLDGVKSYPIKERKSKVTTKDFGKVFTRHGSFSEFMEGLPDILAAKDLKEVVSRITAAYKNQRTIVFALGAHVIKVGLNPVIIDLMEKGIISSIALNGAGVIHDSEIAMTGQTSEDVSNGLREGSFGMADETATVINDAISQGAEKGWGIGKSVGKKLMELDLPYNNLSILASGTRLRVPITVHAAIGTDIIHMHPSCNGAAIGKGSHLDFRLFSSIISSMEKGIYLNIGSSVILPEVFLKALTLVRNLGFNVKDFTTVNMDFIQHYRPVTNVVKRPTLGGGMGYSLIGHHEIMVPLLAAAVLEEIDL
jgi:deoxyhypusine synthase